MEPHDIYFVFGGFLPLFGIIGYFTARADDTPVWFPVTLFCLGIGSLGYTWLQIGNGLTPSGFGDSVFRIMAATF